MTLCIALLIMSHVSKVSGLNPDIVQYFRKENKALTITPFLRQVVSTSILNTSRTKSRSITRGGRKRRHFDDDGNRALFEDELGNTIARGYRIIRVTIVNEQNSNRSTIVLIYYTGCY